MRGKAPVNVTARTKALVRRRCTCRRALVLLRLVLRRRPAQAVLTRLLARPRPRAASRRSGSAPSWSPTNAGREGGAAQLVRNDVCRGVASRAPSSVGPVAHGAADAGLTLSAQAAPSGPRGRCGRCRQTQRAAPERRQSAAQGLLLERPSRAAERVEATATAITARALRSAGGHRRRTDPLREQWLYRFLRSERRYRQLRQRTPGKSAGAGVELTDAGVLDEGQFLRIPGIHAMASLY
jgi:hypothetical protein